MAMLKNKHMTFSLILVCLIVVSPMATNGLLDLVSGFLGGLLGGGGGGLQGGLLLGGLLGGGGGNSLQNQNGGLLNVANIQGPVFCTPNGALNITATPAFANASVELRCGKENVVVSNSTTNAFGLFSIPSNNINMLLSTLLSDCKLVVTTPLATCSASLPSVGNLASQLTVIGSTISGLLNIVNIVPSGFNLI